MNLRWRLWLYTSAVTVIIVMMMYWIVAERYEQRVLDGQEQLMYAQGQTVVETLAGTYPRSPDRTSAYLMFYAERNGVRMLLINGHQYQVIFDSFNILTAGTPLALTVFDAAAGEANTTFIATTNYGYVQYTSMPLMYPIQDGIPDAYLLMIRDVNVVYEDIQAFQRWMSLLMAGGIGAAFLLSYLVVSGMTRPIARLITALKQIGPRRRTFTMTYHRSDEIGQLVNTIREMVGELNQFEARQREFLSASSHELKTPLATMQLILENLPQLRDDPELFAEYSDDLTREVTRMRALVDELLHINQISDQPLQWVTLTTEEIQQHVLNTFQHMSSQRNIELEFDMGAETVRADDMQLMRLIDNLISNAIRYSPRGGKVTLQLRVDEQQANLSVSDQGIGMNEDEQLYAFDAFYRAPSALEHDPQGTGLGLAQVKKIAERHGGKVSLFSEVDRGTKVQVSWPQAKLT